MTTFRNELGWALVGVPVEPSEGELTADDARRVVDALLPIIEAERDKARATLAKAYEHAAFQAGVQQFASKKAWLRQMELTRESGGNDGQG